MHFYQYFTQVDSPALGNIFSITDVAYLCAYLKATQILDDNLASQYQRALFSSATQAIVYSPYFSLQGTSRAPIAHSIIERLGFSSNRQFPSHLIEDRLSQNSTIENKRFAPKLVQSEFHERQISRIDFGAQEPTARGSPIKEIITDGIPNLPFRIVAATQICRNLFCQLIEWGVEMVLNFWDVDGNITSNQLGSILYFR